MMRIFTFSILLLPCLVLGATIADKKQSASRRGSANDASAQETNDRLVSLRSELQRKYQKAASLNSQGTEEGSYRELLSEINRIRQQIFHVEEKWREAAISEAKQDEDGYALFDQEETTIASLSMEFGSPDFVYIVPPEIAGMKINMHSNIPVPRESWSSVLETILMHNGVGVKKLNSYAKQLYILKQDLGSVRVIASRPSDLLLYGESERIFYVFSPPVEQVKAVFQFFEKFSDSKQTFVHPMGSKIAIVSSREEVQKLIALYDAAWDGSVGKISRVVSVSKISVKEMEKILTSFFGDSLERNRPPFAKQEQDGLGVFSLGQSNTLVLIGTKEIVDRAEKIVRETEEQLEDPAEMTVFVYSCRHTDPTDLAQVLEKVYVSLLTANQEMNPKQTDYNFSAQGAGGGGRVPDGYPAIPPLVVSPPPLKPGISSHLEVDQEATEHFIPDPKTGNLLMTVRRDVLGKIKDLLKKLDVPKKMVQIEVLLFERRLNSQNNFGLNLLKLGGDKNGVHYTPLGGPPVGAPGILQFFFHGPKHKYTPQFDIAYNFLMTQEDIQLNASPSVITVNQTPATISIVEELSINNGAAPVDTNKGTSFEKSFARVQYGITIILTPTIHIAETTEEKGVVTLKTNISFDTTKPHPDDRPLVDRRHIENEVRIVDGETVILGGLRRKAKQDREEKVPFFGEIPGIGKLFGSTQLTDHDTEMFFFITPKIIYDPQQEISQVRTEFLKKRPGDMPEFLQKVEEARDKERNRYFRQSMQLFFKHDR